jgi:hypothetical protein
MLAGCSLQVDLKNPANAQTEVATVDEERQEIEILSYSYESGVTTMILLDTKENILYGLVEIALNYAGSLPGEFFMLLDSEGNPYVYDGIHIPELILHEQAALENNLMTYVFSDSIYNVRYALLFTRNNNAGAYTGNVITLFNTEGNPSTY